MIDKRIVRDKKDFDGLGRLTIEIVTSWSGRKQSEVWIVHHPVMGCLSLLARKDRLIYICHGPWAEEAKDMRRGGFIYSLLNYARRFLQALLLSKADNIFFLSAYMQNRVFRSLNINPRNVGEYGLVSPIVDQLDNRIRETNTALPDRVYGQIYICRRLVERTGVADFIEKFAQSTYRNQFNIVIAGDGPEREKIEAIVSYYRVEKCELNGFVSDSNHRLNFLRSEFMVLPSLTNEGFGLVIIEAICNGCLPIVSANAGGGADWMSSLYPQLIYDGSIRGLIKSIDYAREHKSSIIRDLKNQTRLLTKEAAAKVIETSSSKQR